MRDQGGKEIRFACGLAVVGCDRSGVSEHKRQSTRTQVLPPFGTTQPLGGLDSPEIITFSAKYLAYRGMLCMSRIDETPRTVEAMRSVSGVAAHGSVGVLGTIDERRSRRWELDVPLTVYGRASSGSPFYHEADAVNASADGGLIVLRAPISEGQNLLLINNWTSKEQMCRVVRVRSKDAETNEVGVVFSSPNPEFWQVPEAPCNLQEDPADEGF